MSKEKDLSVHYRPVISTSTVCAALGFNVSVKLLNELGIKEAMTTGQGSYWFRDEFNNICFALAMHLFDKTRVHPVT